MELFLGKVFGMSSHPLPGEYFAMLLFGWGFVQSTVTFNLANLFAHSGAEQGLFIDKGDAHQIAMFAAQAPSHIAVVARVFAQGGQAYPQCGAAAPGTVVIASHAAEADSVQPLARNTRTFAQGQFHWNITWMR